VKAELLVLVVGIALAPLEQKAVAQTLTNPGGIRGGPTVSVPLGGMTGTIGGGPQLEPMKIDLKPTLPSIQTPTVNQPTGLPNSESDAPKHPVPPSPPPEAGPDGDAETPDGSGTPAVDAPLATGVGEGPTELSIPPAPRESGRGSSHWIWIGVGAIAIFVLGARWGGRK
jgi:hypothetical protein